MPARPVVVLLLLLLLLAPAHAGEPLAHEKFQLGNGLTVILHEDHALPLVAVNVWYHVGSREEPQGRSGFAHLFEHLMFMGTARAPGNAFDTMLEAGGGSNNASTDFDRTNYFSWGPASLLPTMLWLEADRMEGVGAAMTQEKLDLQRDVVRNERRQGYDNAPYGPSELMVWELMYPEDHPYHNHVIGSHEDLARATVEDVQQFFATYYVPNNATLVVAGDFDAAEVKRMIQGYFGPLPRGGVPPRRSASPAALERPLRVHVEDDVQLGRLTLVWHSPAWYAPGDAEMDLAASVLAEGKASRLQRRLVHEEHLAQDVYAWQESLRLGGLFHVQVTAAEGVTLERLEQVVDEEISRLLTEGPEPHELQRIVSSLETNALARLQGLGAVADQLNEYDALLGHPDRLDWDLDRYRKAAPADVRGVARRVLGNGSRLVLTVTPRASPPEGLPALETPPPAPAPRAFEPPRPDAFRLSNGLEVRHFDRPELPLVALQLLMPAGSLLDAEGKSGQAHLAGQMLDEGAGSRDALAFSEALDLLGTRISTAVAQDTTTAYMQVLKRNVDPALALLGDVLRAPRYDAADFERVKRRHLLRLRQTLDDPETLASRVAQLAFFGGPAASYAAPAEGFPASVEALTLEDVKRFHAAYHRPEGAVLVVAGDLRGAEARALLERHLGAWKGAGEPPPVAVGIKARAPQPGLRVLLVDRPDAAQTVVRFVLPGVHFGAPERKELQVLNTLLGGNFLSRLNLNLREKNGYTYGAGSSFQMLEHAGTFTASASVETGVTGPAIGEFLKELARMATGDVTDEEASTAKATVESETVQAFQTLSGVIGAWNAPLRFGLGPDALGKDLERVRRADATRLNALARAHVRLDAGILVLVGDRVAVLPQLEGLGLAAPLVISPEQALAGRW